MKGFTRRLGSEEAPFIDSLIDSFRNPVLESLIMLDPRLLRERPDEVRKILGPRGAQIDWERLGKLDRERRDLLVKVEKLRHERRNVSDRIAKLKREKQPIDPLMDEVKAMGDRLKLLEENLRDFEGQFDGLALLIPNLPHESVPSGRDAADTVEIRRWGEPPEFGFPPKPHWELGEELGILNFERAARMTGARFTVYTGAGAR